MKKRLVLSLFIAFLLIFAFSVEVDAQTWVEAEETEDNCLVTKQRYYSQKESLESTFSFYLNSYQRILEESQELLDNNDFNSSSELNVGVNILNTKLAVSGFEKSYMKFINEYESLEDMLCAQDEIDVSKSVFFLEDLNNKTSEINSIIKTDLLYSLESLGNN